MRTTDFSRTKMTALVALAAMYPPPTVQRWNPNLNWQPIPYDTMPLENDDVSKTLLREKILNYANKF